MDPHVRRRETLMSRMGQGAAIFPTSSELLRNGDSHFGFRPDSDFWYLTGFAEPDAMLVLTPNHPTQRTTLFLRPRDPKKEVWNGRRLGVEAAPARLHVDAAYPFSEWADRLPALLEGSEELFYRPAINPVLDQKIFAILHTLRQAKRRLTTSPWRITDPTVLLHDMRLFKEEGELELMRKAARITAHAHVEAMKATRAGTLEYELAALIEYEFRRMGAVGPGYNTIVGGGENATILHYIENSDALKAGDLVLIDAGAEFRYYTADITRTYPVSGRFSPVQRDVYQVVLESQLAAIDKVRVGEPFQESHLVALRVLTSGLVSLGILKGSLDELLEKEAYLPYYMHRTSHWLGLDVHDAGDYVRSGASRVLEPGMVLTIEPGLYFGPDAPAPAEFQGIGIRIEDDVLVRPEGPEVLTHGVPKGISEIESLVGTASGHSRPATHA